MDVDQTLETLDLSWFNSLVNCGFGEDEIGGGGESGEVGSLNSIPEFVMHSSDDLAKKQSYSNPPNKVDYGTLVLDSNFRVFRERLTQAIRRFKQSSDQHALVQVWVPVKNGDRWVLTTYRQPFVLDPQNFGLLHYRNVSISYLFSLDDDEVGKMGLPGRVFRQKLPEWTPNVQYYSSREYPRLCHAMQYNVQGTLGLPVFEMSTTHNCIGVIEIIMTDMKINYAPEVDKVCKALEAVNLKSAEVVEHPQLQICNENRQAALAEILEILTMVSETCKLPLAQTWVPCMHRNVIGHGSSLQKNCTSFDGSCMGQICMSTTDAAFYVIDAQVWGFRDACLEHHLQMGYGVPGTAFVTRRPCFSSDITKFTKLEYPLVHYARLFGLAGCLAICLRSEHTGMDDYILEFFLPQNCRDFSEQQALLDTLLTIIKHCCQCLRIVIDVELEIDNIISVTQNREAPVPTTNGGDNQDLGVSLSSATITHKDEVPPPVCQQPFDTPAYTSKQDDAVTNGTKDNKCTTSSSNVGGRTSEKKRTKSEKSISLEVLQKYFAGSLKDAAMSLGVCPTTMKRICRQNGIKRWPSRKIKKVNRSICKLQRVIDSVQVAEGTTLTLASLASSQLMLSVNSRPLSQSSSEGREHLLNPEQKGGIETEMPPAVSQLRQLMADESEQVNGQPEHYLTDAGLKGIKWSNNGSHSCEGSSRMGSRSSSQNSPINGEPNEVTLEHDLIENAALRRNDPVSVGLASMSEPSPPSANVKNNHENLPKNCGNPLTITFKAAYKDDIIRFRHPASSGLLELKEEIGKRLKMELGTFDIKYRDDDQEWVLLACEDDFLECVDITKLGGGGVVRLQISDMVSSLGSSCESSGG